MWRKEFLAYFDTGRASNGPTEAVNLLVEKIRRIGHGYRRFDHYRLRLLLHCGITYSHHGSEGADPGSWRRAGYPGRATIRLIDSAGAVELLVPEGDPSGLAPALRLLRQHVSGVVAFQDGRLETSFRAARGCRSTRRTKSNRGS